MSFKLLLLHERTGAHSMVDTWPEMLKERIPDIEVNLCGSVGEAMEVIEECDAAFGNIVPELFERGGNLRWIASPQAGPRAGYYHEALIASDVVVTNTREIYNEHISIHIMTMVLAFAKGLHTYIRSQIEGRWEPGYEVVHLPDATAVIVGIGGIGGETARVCAELGMTVLGVDPRVPAPPRGWRSCTGPTPWTRCCPGGTS